MGKNMTPKNYIYYNINSGLIENVIYVSDDVASQLTWPDGYAIAVLPNGLCGEWSTCGAGWSYIDGQFIEPPMPPAEEQPVVSGGVETL